VSVDLRGLFPNSPGMNFDAPVEPAPAGRDAEIARSFYDHPSSAPAPQPSEPQPTERERAETEAALQLFPTMREEKPVPVEVPANIAELREGDFYDPVKTFSGLKFDAPPEDLSAEEKELVKAAHDETRRIFSDVGLNTPAATEVLALAQEHTRTPPSAEQVVAWQDEAIDQVKRAHGADAEAVLADAQRLIARDKRVSNFLQKTGLGSHPRVVALAIELAKQQRMQGRLK